MADNTTPQAFKRYSRLPTLHRYRDKACRVKFSPNGLLVAVDSGRTFRTYSLPPSQLSFHREFSGHAERVTDLAFSSDSRFIASSSSDSTIRLWDVSRGSLVRTSTGHNDPVLCVKFNPKSNTIASGSFDETVRIWDVDTGACLKVLPVNSGLITSIDFNPDGSMIVAGSLSGHCRIWNTATGNGMIMIQEVGTPAVGSVNFSSDGKFVLVGTMDNTLRLWSIESGKLHNIYVGQSNKTGSILSTFVGPDEKYIVSGSEDNCWYIWEVRSGRMVQKCEAHMTPVLSVSCHPTQNMIASAAVEDIDAVKIWTQDY